MPCWKAKLRVVRWGFLVQVLFSALDCSACTVPVFRYALERWRPDAFQVTVFHRGELSSQQRQLLKEMSAATRSDRPPVNVSAATIDIEEAPADTIAPLDQEAEAALPWMVVRPPAAYGSEAANIVSTGFTPQSVAALLHSPLREEIVQRLLDGDAVVWIFLESGDDAADSLAAETLQSELDRLRRELRLPTIDEADIVQENLTVDPAELKIAFSMLRLSRDDPHERLLVDLLLNSESDLRDEEFAGKPMAFPLFGRGRVLYGLIGAGINSRTIEDACRYLIGACQCTVKAENPGVDLLLAADWDAGLQPRLESQRPAPELVGLTGFTGADGPPSDRDGESIAASAPDAEIPSDAVAALPAESVGEQISPVPGADPEVADETMSSGEAGAYVGQRALRVLVALFVIVASLSLATLRRRG